MQIGHRNGTYLIRMAMERTVSSAMQEYVRSAPPTRVIVLDVGGRGRPYGKLVLDHLEGSGRKARYVVLDPDPGADVMGRAERLPVGTGSVDLVLCTQVLEHVADPDRAVAEMRRVLKPTGRCLLTTHGTWFYHPDPEDYWRWTPAGLATVFARAGFEEISVQPVGGTKLALATLLLTSLERAPGIGRLGPLLSRLLIAPANVVGSRWLLRRLAGRRSVPGELAINYLVTATRSAPTGA